MRIFPLFLSIPLLIFLTVFFIPSFSLADRAMSPKDEMEMLDKEIHNILGNTQSCESDNQCQTIGYGDKPCGGFRSYLSYSTQVTDKARLDALVEHYNKLDRMLNQQNNMMGTCEAAVPPSLSCQNSVCTVRPFSLGLPVAQ